MKRNHLIYLKIMDLLKDGAFNRSSGYHTFVFSSLSLKEVQSLVVVVWSSVLHMCLLWLMALLNSLNLLTGLDLTAFLANLA